MIPEKDFAGRQLLGARAVQEDAYAFSEIPEGGMLIVVADGMGGHSAGELASELALKNFIAAFHEKTDKIDNRLRKALQAANEAIAKELQRNPKCEGMGTTLVAACITSVGIEWISVGDSPLYLWRDKKLTRLNADHSLRPVLREMAERGDKNVNPEDSSKNILRAALTGEEISMIDQSPEAVALRKDDFILVATDGIHTLSENTIAAMNSAGDASAIADSLLDAVRGAKNPRQDNTSVAILRSTSSVS
jgi:serine/threonine protein phosphatase PrpC